MSNQATERPAKKRQPPRRSAPRSGKQPRRSVRRRRKQAARRRVALGKIFGRTFVRRLVTSIAVALFISFGFSSILMIANMLLKSSFPVILQSPINAGAFAMIAGLVLVPVVSLVTPKLPKAHLDHVFSCYDRKVTVSVKDSIGDHNET